MKKLDILAAVLLVIGGLNWGLYGLFQTDLVNAAFGGTALATVIYALVGLAAVWQAFGLRAIQRRWQVEPALSN
jgi:uncharacterized membrane protein YuzA (DUF378 family)